MSAAAISSTASSSVLPPFPPPHSTSLPSDAGIPRQKTTTTTTTAALAASSSAHPVAAAVVATAACRGKASGKDETRMAAGSTSYCALPPTANAVDSVLDEISDLLQAASESQSLGRLRNSYSCLLLAHQRLVGLGRRVDRSYCEGVGGANGGVVVVDAENENGITTNDGDVAENAVGSTTSEPKDAHPDNNFRQQQHRPPISASTTSAPSRTPPPRPLLLVPPLIAQPPLPAAITTAAAASTASSASSRTMNGNATNNEDDAAYVEYLARSSMELHHRRTGRGLQHEAAMVRAAHAAKVRKMEEEQLVQAARGVFALSKTLSGGGGRGDEINATVDDGTNSNKDGSMDGKKQGKKGGAKRKKSAAGGTTSCNSDDEPGDAAAAAAGGGDEGDEDDADDDDNNNNITPTRKKGGRGKKPPTLVMHTMAGRNLDVRELMRGIL